ncbi:MAG: hypothetical protein ACI9UN_000261 [Granulosicoccus sp.]|jgi:hypothetical protein
MQAMIYTTQPQQLQQMIMMMKKIPCAPDQK